MTHRYGYTKVLPEGTKNPRLVIEYEIIDAFDELQKEAEQAGHKLDWDSTRLILGKEDAGRYLRVSINQQTGEHSD